MPDRKSLKSGKSLYPTYTVQSLAPASPTLAPGCSAFGSNLLRLWLHNNDYKNTKSLNHEGVKVLYTNTTKSCKNLLILVLMLLLAYESM